MDNFDTTQATSLINMFRSCSSLTSLYLPKFYTNNIKNENLNSMFEGCNNLKLSLYPEKCSNLISLLPSYVELLNLTNY